MKVLDPHIRKQHIGSSKVTFSDLEDRRLITREHIVSGALLSDQATKAIRAAHAKEWIDCAERESLLALVDFCSLGCAKAQWVSAWLRDSDTAGWFHALLCPPLIMPVLISHY